MKPQIPMPSESAAAASQQLAELIQHRIRTSGGWIPFAEFMQLALYTPQLGYYSGGSTKIGADGDFITAPTLTPLFGQTLAHQAAPVLAETAGNIYEFGAGTGALAVQLINALSDDLNHYYIIEASSELAARQQQLAAAQLPPHLAAKIIHLPTLPEQFNGLIIGNEVLDAMPVELVCHRDGQYQQIGVVIDTNGFEQSSRPIASPALLAAAEQYLPPIEDYTSELHLQQHAFIRTLAERLECGGMIWIDYGFDAGQYYHPQRSMGTLIGHYRHHTVHDPFFHIGLTDLTAHVNFTDIAQAGTDGGLDLIGYTTQAHFLLNLGLPNLLAQCAPVGSPDYTRQAAAVQQLISPHEMGELFKVMVFGKNISVDWQGFAFGDICHKL